MPATRGATLTTTHRVIDGVHGDAAYHMCTELSKGCEASQHVLGNLATRSHNFRKLDIKNRISGEQTIQWSSVLELWEDLSTFMSQTLGYVICTATNKRCEGPSRVGNRFDSGMLQFLPHSGTVCFPPSYRAHLKGCDSFPSWESWETLYNSTHKFV